MGLVSACRATLLRTSLQTKVVVLVAFVCLTLVGLDGWRTWQDRQTQIAEDQVATANLAKSLGQHAHDVIQAADTAIVGLRDAVETEGVTPASVKHLNRLMATQVAALPVLHSLIALDAAGTYVAASSSLTGKVPSASDRAYFQYHRSHPDRGVHIGSPVHSKMDGSWIITASRRLNAPDGGFAGVALATISIDFLQKFYETFDVGIQGAIGLTSSEGILIARKPARDAEIGTDVSAGQLHAQLLSPSTVGNFEYVSAIDGVTRLGSYQHVEAFPLVVVVAHGFQEVLARWRTDALLHFLVSLGAVAVVLWLGSRLASQIRKRQQAAIAVRQSERHYRLLADNSTDLITQLGPDLRRLYVSPASEALLGYDPRELVGRHGSDLLSAEDQTIFSASLHTAARDGCTPPVSYRVRRKDGTQIWVETTGRKMPDGEGFIIASRDVTQRKMAEEMLHAANAKLQRLVMLDGLTGIMNRRGFDLALEKEHRRAARGDTALALLLIDVDHFKAFNDLHGHQAGDACLQAVAECIERTMQRPADLATRYGGEEFAVLLPETALDGAVLMAERVRKAVCGLAIDHGGSGTVVTVSVGVAVVRPRHDGQTARMLVGMADAALYEAKASGRDRACCGPGTAMVTASPPMEAPVLTS
ncbi:MAG: sensor domain-containing diguanylate cyclase [Janthinobacterium lividum]